MAEVEVAGFVTGFVTDDDDDDDGDCETTVASTIGLAATTGLLSLAGGRTSGRPLVAAAVAEDGVDDTGGVGDGKGTGGSDLTTSDETAIDTSVGLVLVLAVADCDESACSRLSHLIRAADAAAAARGDGNCC